MDDLVQHFSISNADALEMPVLCKSIGIEQNFLYLFRFVVQLLSLLSINMIFS